MADSKLSSTVPTVHGLVVVNPDGTDIGGSTSSGNIVDGADSGIKATVKDYTNSNPLTVVTVDTNGDYVAAGAGTQYTEDAPAAANPVGGAINLVRDDSRSGSLTSTDGDNVALRGNNKGEAYVKITDSDALLTTIDTDTGNIATSVQLIDDAIYTEGGAFTTDTSKGQVIMGQDTDGGARALRVSDSGEAFVSGLIAHDASDSSTKPIKIGGYAKAAAPTNVSADGDRVNAWFLRNGAQATVLTAAGALIGGDATNGLDVDVTASVLPTGAATSAKQDTGNTSVGNIDTTLGAKTDAKSTATDTTSVSAISVLKQISASVQAPPSQAVTNAGTFVTQENGALLTSSQLLDDTVATLGTTTYTETTTKGNIIGAVRRDADTTLVDTTNEIGPLQMDANGRLKVEAFSGEALPVTLTSTTVTGTVAVTQSGTWDEVGINDSGNSITVDGTITEASGSGILTSVQLIDDTVFVDDTATHSTGSTKGLGIMAAATPTDSAVNANDIGMVAMTTDRKLHVSVQDALPAGTNAIGKLAANSGVDIGDVDVTSAVISSGTITTVTTLTGGGVAHDSADSGNPLKIGMKAFSPDGTTPGTAVAENDRTDAKADLDGRLFVNTKHPRFGHKHLDGSTAYTDEAIVADPGDGFQVIITSIIVSTGAATAMNFFLEEGASKIFGPIYLEATAGRGFVSGPIHLPVTASTAVTATTSASIAQSIDIDYFIQAV